MEPVLCDEEPLLPPLVTQCAGPNDCEVRPASCCGSCGAATRADAVALNYAYAATYADAVCTGEGCPLCDAEPDRTLLASCQDGTCVVVDLLLDPATQCTTAEECHVRTADCCECGGSTNLSDLVAVSDDSAFEALVCEPMVGCDTCMPTYPAIATECVDGHCRLAP